MVLRHLASELNRWMFGAGGLAQTALALAVLALSWPAGGAPRTLLLLAAVLVAAQLFGARSIVELGRSIDFVPRPLPADLARAFRDAPRCLRDRGPREGRPARVRRLAGSARLSGP